MRAIDELRDPWALGVAAAAGVVAYAATVPWQYALVAALVIVAFRVGAGLLLTVLAPRTAAPVPDIPLRPDDRGPLFGETLTPREREIAALVYEGLRNKEIAARLVIDESTAKKHVEHIREKLGFHTRAQIAKWWAEQQISTRNTH